MANWFNDEWKTAVETGIYWCPKCGALMHFEDEDEDVLICDECSYDMPAEKYGYTDEKWDDLQTNGFPVPNEIE